VDFAEQVKHGHSGCWWLAEVSEDLGGLLLQYCSPRGICAASQWNLKILPMKSCLDEVRMEAARSFRLIQDGASGVLRAG